MNKISPPLLALVSMLPLTAHAGSWSEPLPGSAPAAGYSSATGLFDFPALKFGHRDGTSDLPGFPVGAVAYRHEFTADFDTIGGEVSADDFSAWLPLPPLHFDDIHVLSFLGYRTTSFDTSMPILLTEDQLHSLRLPVILMHDLSEQWMWGAMVMPGLSGDLGDTGDAFSFSAAALVGYSFGPHLQVFAGGFYSHGFDENTLIPGVGFTWNPSPQTRVFVLGPRAGVSYTANDWIFSLTGHYDSQTWNVEPDATGPVRDINVRGFRAGLSAERRLSDAIWAYASGGYIFGRRLQVEDLNSNSLLEDDIDPAPYVQVGLNARF